ncbi:MAG: hypothetical protein KAI57_03610, partial [Candidatus Pacebacteria bacterium]|nr:hypothetical protein [Candidatus Paceibacterota bacterium]
MNNLDENHILSSQTKKSTNSSRNYIGLFRRQKKLKGAKIKDESIRANQRIKDYSNKTKGDNENIVSAKKENNDPNTSNFITISPFMNKVISFAVILVFFVGSFVFVQLEFQKKKIKLDSPQIVKGISINAQEKIISFSNSLGTIKNESQKFVNHKIVATNNILNNSSTQIKNNIIGLNNSLDTISNYGKNSVVAVSSYGKNSIIPFSNLLDTIEIWKYETLRQAQNNIVGLSNSLDIISNYGKDSTISLSNSLDTIKNESTQCVQKEIISLLNSLDTISNYGKTSVVSLSDSLRTIEVWKDGTLRQAQDDIIGLSNSLDTIKNKSTKFASSVILRRHDKESRDRTNETVVQSDAKLNSGSFASLRSVQDSIVNLDNSLNIVKNESARFIDYKIVATNNFINNSSRHIQDDIIGLSDSLNIIKNQSTKFIDYKIVATNDALDDVKTEVTSSLKNLNNKKPNPRVAGVSTSVESEQKSGVIDSIKSFFGGVKNYVSGLFNPQTETTTKIVSQDNQNETTKSVETEKSSDESLETSDSQTGSTQENGANENSYSRKDSISTITPKTVYITQTVDTKDLQNRIEKLEQEIKKQRETIIVGPQGDIGEQGEKGDTGSQGPSGVGSIITVPSSPTNTNTWNNGANVFSGYGSFESLGVAYDLSAGRSFGVGGDTFLGSDSADILTVDATSTFNNPITLSDIATLTTGTGQVTFGGDVDVTGDLTVTGAQTYTGAASFTDSSASAALLVNQQGTGNIVQFQDDGVDSFVLADGGQATISGSTVLGDDANTDTVIFNSQIASNIVPSATNTYDLGSVTNYWNNAYISNMVVGSTNVGGTTSASFILNNDNATADTEDSWLEFERGSTTPNPKITWSSANDYFDFDYPIHLSGTGEFTGPGATGLTINNDSGDLTFSTTTSGDLALTSAGDINITSAGAVNLSSGGTNALSVDSDSGILTLGAGTNQIANTDADTAILINPNGTGAVQFHSTSFYVNSTGDLVFGGRLTFENAEYASNETDDYILFQGSGGADDTDFTFDLDGSQPIIYSATDTSVGVDDDLQFIGAQTISTSAGDLTIDSFANLVIADTTVQYSSGSSTFDIYSNAGATTLTISNSDGTQVAHLDLADGSLYTGGTERLTVAGALANITGYSQTSGDFTIAGTGNILFSTSGTITQSGTGQVSLAGNLDTTNGLDVTGITNLGDGGSTNYAQFSATGDLTFLGSANTIQKSDGALTLNTTAQDLTISTTTSGDLALTSAGAVTTTYSGGQIVGTGTDAITLGNSGDTLALDSSDWDISATGVVTGLSGITNTGALTNTGGAVNLNASSNYATNIGTGTSTGTITVGNATVSDLALNDAQWSITGAGVASFASISASSGAGSFDSLTVGGGYGDTGITMSNAGNIQANGTLTVDGISTLTGATTLGADMNAGGNYLTNSQSINDINAKGSAYRFDGVDDYVTLSKLALSDSDSFTVKANIRIKKRGASQTIISEGLATATATDGFHLNIENTNAVVFTVGNGSSGVIATYDLDDSGITTNDIVSIISIYNNNTTLAYLYINGVLVDTSNALSGGYSTYTANPPQIGRLAYTPAYYNGNDIDDVRIFNRALSATEVKSLYSGAPVDYADIGADGVDILSGWDFTSGWDILSSGVVDDFNTFHPTSPNDGIRKSGILEVGKRYRLNIAGTYAYGIDVMIYAGEYDDYSYGTISGGTFDSSIEFIAIGTGLAFRLLGSVGTVDITELNLTQIGAVLNLEKDGMTEDTWFDKSGNGNDGTVTGATLINRQISPKLVGGDGTTDDITFQTTTGVGATGADMHFLTGNNGATEAMTILNDGSVGIGVIDPDTKLEIFGTTTQLKLSYDSTNYLTLTTQDDGDLVVDSNKTSYDFDLGDGNIITTGTLGAGVATLSTGSTIGNLTLADGSITDSSGAISFGDENLS